MAHVKFPTRKNVGFHRGNPRLYFQSPHLAEMGFAPGQPYAIGMHVDRRIETHAQAEFKKGDRKVCKKVVGEKVFSIIDLNFYMPSLVGVRQVSLEWALGSITIRPITGDQA